MAKFLNKKEQVIDFQLTPYGNYLLSTGIFKPAYYAFYDSSILYDKQYVHGTYCKSASCGGQEITKVTFVSDTIADYTPMSTTSPFGPSQYFTIYNGSTPYNFWFKTSTSDLSPGTGVEGINVEIDVEPPGFVSGDSDDIALRFRKILDYGPWPFTSNVDPVDGSIVGVTASIRGPTTDCSQTIAINVLAASVQLQGSEFEVFRADSDVPTENQNEIHDRIKNKTQYLEGLLAFTGLEEAAPRPSPPVPSRRGESFIYDTTVIKERPAKDVFKFDSAIGDARFDGPSQQYAPGWKIVALQGQISGSSIKDIENDQLIPQINVDVIYSKEIKDIEFDFEAAQVIETIGSISDLFPTSITERFSDGKTIALSAENLVIYTEELNTELLTENFDIEVYEILPRQLDADSVPIGGTSVLKRKFFEHSEPQVVDGLMVKATPETTPLTPSLYLTSSVEYYFDIYADADVNKQAACRGASIFNKNSYYVDIDFECEEEGENTYYDIYGRATDPEICQI